MDKFSSEIRYISPAEVQIPAERQRSGGKDIDTTDLEPSIRERGIINPITVRRDLTLVAGERRLRCALKLGLASVPVRFFEDLDQIEIEIVELEENERRKDLEWRDHVRAIGKLHQRYAERAAGRGEAWSQERTAEMLFYTGSLVSGVLRVSRDIDNPRITSAPTWKAALNILQRLDERRIADAMADIDEVGLKMGARAGALPPAELPSDLTGSPPKIAPSPIIAAAPPRTGIIPAEESILKESFLSWAPGYAGRKFNLIHCDFPYGTTLFNGPQAGGDKWQGGYDDDPEVYWKLIRVFCEHRDNFMAQSAHMMFWFDMDWYRETLDLFLELAPELEFQPKPLIWVKSNNMGILADPRRGPRHIYETCFLASRGDRLIARATSDAHSSPTDKDLHPSCKPEPMLRYFMGMFVDEYTALLDPTCGSGAALRAAESLGAGHVLGLEISDEYADSARVALKSARLKLALNKKIVEREQRNAPSK